MLRESHDKQSLLKKNQNAEFNKKPSQVTAFSQLVAQDQYYNTAGDPQSGKKSQVEQLPNIH